MLLQKDGWDLKLEDQEALRFPRDRENAPGTGPQASSETELALLFSAITPSPLFLNPFIQEEGRQTLYIGLWPTELGEGSASFASPKQGRGVSRFFQVKAGQLILFLKNQQPAARPSCLWT